jgi:hypothetical protein
VIWIFTSKRLLLNFGKHFQAAFFCIGDDDDRDGKVLILFLVLWSRWDIAFSGRASLWRWRLESFLGGYILGA